MKKERIIARIDPEEKKKINDFCRKNNLNVSEFLRKIINERDIGTIKIITKKEKEIFDNLSYQLQKIGVSINQIAHFFNLQHLKNLDKNPTKIGDILLLDKLQKEQLENIKNLLDIALRNIDDVKIKIDDYDRKL